MIRARVRRRETASVCTPGALPMPWMRVVTRGFGGLGSRLGHETDLRSLNLGRPSGRTVLPNRLICSHVARWRDPDSNRGHHDFQGAVDRTRARRKACNSTYSRRAIPYVIPLVWFGLPRVWDSAGALKSQMSGQASASAPRASDGRRTPELEISRA
jgi:hypothetical protein